MCLLFVITIINTDLLSFTVIAISYGKSSALLIRCTRQENGCRNVNFFSHFVHLNCDFVTQAYISCALKHLNNTNPLHLYVRVGPLRMLTELGV